MAATRMGAGARRGAWARASVLALVIGVIGCNMIEVAISSAQFEEMVAAVDSSDGRLDCTIVIEFDQYPKDIDLKDVRIRFHSPALAATADFDWTYISRNDEIVKPYGGYRANINSRPDTPPPLNQPIRVRFSLLSSERTDQMSSLTAELWWGGLKQHTIRRRIADASDS